MATTAIEWATHVYNPFTGCDRVSPGCAHCYAAETAKGNQRKELGRARVAAEQGKPLPVLRYQNDGDPKTSGPGFAFTVHWDKLERPERFRSGARVFVNSMSDVFHEAAPDEAIAALWLVFASRPDVDWLVLTKRPERMQPFVSALADLDPRFVLPNVWLGVSIENRLSGCCCARRASTITKTSSPSSNGWVVYVPRPLGSKARPRSRARQKCFERRRSSIARAASWRC